MRCSVIVILVVLATKTYSQIVPGYQGKKGIVSYQMNVSPAWISPTYLNIVRENNSKYTESEESTFITPFNVTHGLVLERVMGRKFAMAFDYSFVATRDHINFTQRVHDDLLNSDQTFTFTKAPIKIFGNYFTGSFVFYGKRSLAPYGKYFKLSFGHCETYSSFVQPSYTTSVTTTSVPSTVYTFNTKDVHFSIPSNSFGFSFGTNRIYRNKIVVSRGISYSFLFNAYKDKIGSDNDAYGVMLQRLRRHDLLTIYLRIGFLA